MRVPVDADLPVSSLERVDLAGADGLFDNGIDRFGRLKDGWIGSAPLHETTSPLTWKALADPVRREILDLLLKEPRTTGEICGAFGHLTRFGVLSHMTVLKDAGLVEERSEGVRRIYSLRREGLIELREWLDSFWGEALDAFKLEAERSYKIKKGSR